MTVGSPSTSPGARNPTRDFLETIAAAPAGILPAVVRNPAAVRRPTADINAAFVPVLAVEVNVASGVLDRFTATLAYECHHPQSPLTPGPPRPGPATGKGERRAMVVAQHLRVSGPAAPLLWTAAAPRPSTTQMIEFESVRKPLSEAAQYAANAMGLEAMCARRCQQMNRTSPALNHELLRS